MSCFVENQCPCFINTVEECSNKMADGDVKAPAKEPSICWCLTRTTLALGNLVKTTNQKVNHRNTGQWRNTQPARTKPELTRWNGTGQWRKGFRQYCVLRPIFDPNLTYMFGAVTL